MNSPSSDTGKTTFLQNWMREINSGRFNGDDALACYVSVEEGKINGNLRDHRKEFDKYGLIIF
jgi:hypothetical protein